MAEALATTDARADVAEELRRRVLLVMMLGSVALGLLLSLLGEAQGLPDGVGIVGFALTALPLLQMLLLRWRYRLGRWFTGLSFLALSLAAPYLLRTPLSLCLVPAAVGLVTLLLGSVPGSVAAAVVSAALVVGAPAFGLSGAVNMGLALAGLWAVQGLLWASTGAVAQVVGWWSFSYQRMRELLEEARSQRVELKQTQEDLVQANLELARVSERLRSMREVAEEARRAKEEFVANVSHELRTPLNMIIGFTEMIAEAPGIYDEELPPRLLADIDVILTSSRHLASLVDDVLDLSQVDAGRMALSREWLQIHDLALAAVTAVTPLYQSKGLSLDVSVPENLPPIYADRTRIRQVLLNLLSNAGRFTERGGVRIVVAQGQGTLVCSVADTGPGISEEGQRRIFEPFAQGDGSIRRRYGGSGLGLAISKRFVELHGGKMWLDTHLGEGTTFFFSLPLEVEAEGTAPVAAGVGRWFSPYGGYEPRSRPSKAPRLKLTPRYVVVEAGDMLRRLLSRYQDEAEVVAVPNVEAAVDAASHLPAQAVIVNDASFVAAGASLDRLAALPYGTPILTCWLPDRKEAAERLGLVRYLMKPVRGDTLLETLGGMPGPIETVLVVDDEPAALQLFGRILQGAGRGYRVLRAPTGQRALALLRERRPDVMLLDLVLPDMDGYNVLREKSLDEAIRHIPVVGISAQDPARGPLTSNLLTISRSGGLYPQDVLKVIDALSKLLTPPDQLH